MSSTSQRVLLNKKPQGKAVDILVHWCLEGESAGRGTLQLKIIIQRRLEDNVGSDKIYTPVRKCMAHTPESDFM